MQDRYAGDIGDFVKLGLIRALVGDLKLGVGWYRYPDEGHNNDGRHTAYLRDPSKWRRLDPELFDGLARLVEGEQRSVAALESARLLPCDRYSSELLECESGSFVNRSQWRTGWLDRLIEFTEGCDLVFADPDNGLCADHRFKAGSRRCWKSISLTEVRQLCAGRMGIIYHHNTRRPGGHSAENRFWMELLGVTTIAIRWRPYSPRTFFIVNPTEAVRSRARAFANAWREHVEIFEAT